MKTFNLMDFVPPANFACYFKNIPMEEYTPETKKLIRKTVGRSVYFKFRGPRYYKDHCLKEDAVKFDVYPRNY
jgi:hypothetical protein